MTKINATSKPTAPEVEDVTVPVAGASSAQPSSTAQSDETRKGKKRGPRKASYGKKKFAAVAFGPQGARVRVFERGSSGTIWIEYRWGGEKVRYSLGIIAYNSSGQIDGAAQARINELQQRASELIRAGTEPTRPQLFREAPAPAAEPSVPSQVRTLAEGFAKYLGPEGPSDDWSKLHHDRNKLVRDRVLKTLGPNKLLEELTLRDLRVYFRFRRRTIRAESIAAEQARRETDAVVLAKRAALAGKPHRGRHKLAEQEKAPKTKATHPALRAARGRRTHDGTRQATIEVRCLMTMLRWLAEEDEQTHVPVFSRPKFLTKALRKAKSLVRRDAFTNEEVAKFERVLSSVDPRLKLLLTMQCAQRAGQLIRAMRDGLIVERDDAGNVTAVSVHVPGQRGKEAGRYFLTPEGTRALLHALELGHLHLLERQYRETGKDYPLFPGLAIGERFHGGKGSTLSRRLAPDGVIPVKEKAYPCFDRDTANEMFLDLEEVAGVQHIMGRAFHGFRRRAVDILLELGATPQELQAAGSWTSLRTPLEIYSRKMSEKDKRRAADLLAGHTLKAVEPPAPPPPSTDSGPDDPPPDDPPPGGPPSGGPPGAGGAVTGEWNDEEDNEAVELELAVCVGADGVVGTDSGTTLAHVLKAQHLSDANIEEVLRLTRWAMRGSNPRPRACEARALTS